MDSVTAIACPITGTTRTIPLLAYPSAHVRTPSFANPELARRAANVIVIPWQVHPAALAEVMNALRRCESVAGMLITVPHKTTAASRCDELSEESAALETVNVVRRTPEGKLIGGNLDGRGLLRGLLQQGHDLRARRILLLGAGGAASAIALALAGEPIRSLTISNRSPQKARQLASVIERLTGKVIGSEMSAAADYDVIINATSLGMKANDPLPLENPCFRPGQLVVEAVMQPPVTRFLQTAREAGATVHPGEHMIVGQIGLLLDFILGAHP